MKFLDGLFEGKASDGQAIPTPSGDSKSINRVRGGTSYYSSIASGYDSEKAVRQFYEKVIWVYRCIDSIADNASRLPIIIKNGSDPDSKEVKMPQVWRLLNRRPNTYETAQMFRYRMSTLLLLSRKGIFIEVVPSKAGIPAELHILPLSTEPIKDPKKFVSGFKIRGDDNKDYVLPVYGAEGTAKDENAVIWIRAKAHPTDPYAQMTPLVTAGLTADTDYFARLFNRNFMQNDGRPGMLIAVRGKLGREDALELKNYFSGGLMQAGSTRVIEADDISVADMSGSPRDAQYMETLRGAKEDILLAFGVSESFLGNASGRTFDNADAEFEITWTTTMISHIGAIGAGFDPLTGDVNDDKFVVHDVTGVDVLQRVERRRHDKALEEFGAGLITWDEYREATGKKPWDVPASRVAYLPIGVVVAMNDGDQEALKAIMPGAAPPPGLGGEVPGEIDPWANDSGDGYGTDEGQGAAPASNVRSITSAARLRLAGKILALATHERKAISSGSNVIKGEVIASDSEALDTVGSKAHPYDGLRGRIEAGCTATFTAWSRRQEKAVLARVAGPGATEHTRHYEGAKVGTKALDGESVVKPAAWARDIRADIADLMRDEALAQVNRTAKELDKRGVLAVMGKGGPGDPVMRLTSKHDEEIVRDVIKPILDMVEKAGRRQSERVADVIKQMDKDGKSMTEIKAEVRRMIGSRSSWFKGLAIHATTALVEGVQAEVLKHAEKNIVRTWHTEADEKVRKTHWENEGEEQTGGKPWVVGKSLLMFPGDPDGDVSETANCRCWTTWTPAKSVVLNRGRANRELEAAQ